MNPPNEFDCKMLDHEIHLAPGQTTVKIRTQITATYSRQAAGPYTGPGANVTPGGEFNAELIGMGGASGPYPGFFTGKFAGNTWTGYTEWQINGASMPGGSFIDLGVSATDGDISGNTYPFCRVYLAAPAPVTKHVWAFKNDGVVLGMFAVKNPENVSLTRDGVLMYPPDIFGGRSA